MDVEKNPKYDRNKMCFTEHSLDELDGLLDWLKTTPLPVECLDAFLYDYRKTGNLDSAIFFAICEWDC